MRGSGLCFLIIFFCLKGYAQVCSGPGQTPARAFPVCGTVTFRQTTVPLCVTQDLEVPGCSNAAYQDKNPYWYRFTCYQNGSLGFLIKPIDMGDDYDWQLYDITNKDPQEVFTDKSLIVTGNWAGTYGNTGASSTGVNFIQCASDPSQNKNSFSTMPQLIAGHTYLLLVSHFTDSQIGYDLSFGGGTAVITDPLTPKIDKAEAACNGSTIRIKLNKKIKCSSIAADGSDFFVSTTGAVVNKSEGLGCSAGFDTDSLTINLSTSLGPGSYQLHAKKGSDGNTLLDNCDNALSESDAISFTVFPLLPTPMDSMVPVSCSPNSLKLYFRKPIACSSIAGDGSDFKINGTYPVAIAGAAGVCNAGGTSKEIIITLTKPLEQKGSFILLLQQGSDGNSLLDECSKETPAGASLPFSVKDTVNADFSHTLYYGCVTDTVDYFHDGKNEVNLWKWNMDEGKTSRVQNPRALYNVFNEQAVSLIVSNGFCSDTTTKNVQLDNFLKADFEVRFDNCPLEPIQFTGAAMGNVARHEWTFGDGQKSAEKSPKHTYSQPSSEILQMVNYTVTDSLGCQKTALKPVKIYSSCTVYIPNAFTPNNDGKNDFFSVLNAVKAEKFQLHIYNRWGQLVFQSANWKDKWDGKINGKHQGGGIFVWFVKYIDSRNNQPVERKGTVVLIR